MNPFPENNTFVFRQEDDRIFISDEYSIPVSQVIGQWAGSLLRFVSFQDNVLTVRPDGKMPEKGFDLASSKNKGLFFNVRIDKVIISSQRQTIMSAQHPVKRYNSLYLGRGFVSGGGEQKLQASDTIEINNIKFNDGNFSFAILIRAVGKKVEFQIPNNFIEQHHDAVKNYFIKMLGTKKVNVNIAGTIVGKEVMEKRATCTALESIDKHFLDRIDEKRIKDIILDAKIEGTCLLEDKVRKLVNPGQDTESVFNYLVQEAKTKHYHHLRYLSSKQVHGFTRLAITGKPFTYIFLIRENGRYFIVWEPYTVDAATYVWCLDSTSEGASMQEEYNLIMQKIGLLNNKDKLKFKQNLSKQERVFHHNYELELYGFFKWKKDLGEIMDGLT